MLKHLIMCLLAICMSSWEKKSIQVFCPFLNRVVFFVFLLEDNALQYCGGLCHTSVQISHDYIIYLLPLKPPSPPHPSPLGRHRARSWAPCTTQQLPASCLF